jgi:hypothetical protein
MNTGSGATNKACQPGQAENQTEISGLLLIVDIDLNALLFFMSWIAVLHILVIYNSLLGYKLSVPTVVYTSSSTVLKVGGGSGENKARWGLD